MEVDLLTVSICVSVALVSAAVVYLGSVFGIKEKTYDEAVQEQRRKALLDFGDVKPSSKKGDKEKGKVKKDKKDKDKDSKDKKKKKSKTGESSGAEKSRNKEPASSSSDHDSGEKQKSKPAIEKEATVVIGATMKSEKASSSQVKAKLPEEVKPVTTTVITKVNKEPSNSNPLVAANDAKTRQPTAPEKKKVQPEMSSVVVETNDQKKIDLKSNSTATQKPKPSKKVDKLEPASTSGGAAAGSLKEDVIPKNIAIKEPNKAKQAGDVAGGNVEPAKKESEGRPMREPKSKDIIKENKPPKDAKDGKDTRDSTDNKKVREDSSVGQVNGNVSGSIEEPIKTEEAKVSLASPGRKAKRPKGNLGKGEDGSNINEFSSKQLIDYINNHPLDNEEIQLLINVLLNKQGDESNQWKKKHDPLDAIKEQLHEREQEVTTLSQNLQATRARMKELRLELEHEKSVHAMTKDKLVQHNTELNNLRNTLQQTCEQQRMEVKALQTKLKEQDADAQARNMALGRLKDENNRMKLAIQQLEAERANLESIPRLHSELEQLRAERRQMERRQSAMQQTNEELLRNIDKMSEQIKSLTSAKQNDEYAFQKKMKEVQEQLRQHDVSKAALLEDYKSSVDKCNQVEQEKQMIEKKSEEDFNALKERIRGLEIEKERLQEASNSKASSNEEKDGLINRLQEEINNLNNELKKSQEEFSRLEQTNGKIREELEQTKKESEVKVNEALAQSKASYEERINRELEEAAAAKKSVEFKLSELSEVKNSLEEERARLKRSLNRINETEEDICKGLDCLVEELLALRVKIEDGSRVEQLEKELEEIKTSLKLEQERLEKAQAEAQNFKDALSKTDGYLKDLEQKSRDAFEQSSNATKECQRLQELIDKLEQDKVALENNVSQVESLKDTVKDIQAKYDELQVKSDTEENDRKLLETKYQDAESKIVALEETLKTKETEMNELNQNLSNYETLKAEVDEIKKDLEKERKLCKEFKQEKSRFETLVKIGQDTLAAEQKRIQELEQLLHDSKQNNGSLSNKVALSNYGSSDSLPLNDVVSQDPENKEEPTNTRSDLTTTKTNSKPHESKKRGAKKS